MTKRADKGMEETQGRSMMSILLRKRGRFRRCLPRYNHCLRVKDELFHQEREAHQPGANYTAANEEKRHTDMNTQLGTSYRALFRNRNMMSNRQNFEEDGIIDASKASIVQENMRRDQEYRQRRIEKEGDHRRREEERNKREERWAEER